MEAAHHTRLALPTAPRLVFFGVSRRRDLVGLARAAAPAQRFVWRQGWTEDPGEPGAGLLGRRHGDAAGMWLWEADEGEFAAQATAVLLRFVHPLVASGQPFCLGVPFERTLLAPRALEPRDAAQLDLEDIGRLLGVGDAAAPQPAPRRSGARRLSGSGAIAPVGLPGPPDDTLDAAQRRAVEHARGPARVLAPAGSGKTKTLVSRVAELVRRGADPGGILLLAFNRKAAEQLEERLAALGIPTTRRLAPPQEREERRRPGRPPEAAGVHCATFNALGYRYQRQVLGARIRVDLDGPAQRRAMRSAMEEAGVFAAGLRPARGSDPVGAFLAALALVRAALCDPDTVTVRVEAAEGTSPVTVPFAAAHSCHLRAQRVAGRQSFDDQIWFAVADMLAEPVRRQSVQDRFSHILVDEFQDLNGAQLALVDILSRPGRSLFVVGDDDQLIYGWRHADPRGILEFPARMPPAPHSATYVLQTNYRCSRAVVEAGARLVANNAVREVKDIRPRPGAQEGALRFAGAPDWPRRAAAVCSFLTAEKVRLGCAWRELAVLCRYRSQQLLVALALDDAGIPRTPTLGCVLFSHPAAGLLRDYVRLVQTPEAADGAATAALLNRPNRFIRGVVAEAVAAARRPWAAVLSAAAREPQGGPRPLSDLVRQVEWLREALLDAGVTRPLTAAELLWAVVDEFGLEQYWQAASGGQDRDTAARGPGGDAGGQPADAGGDPSCAAGGVTASAAGTERDGAGPLQVLDALLLLAETYPDPAVFFAVWDRLEADEPAHEGVADDDLAREESGEDRVIVGTIHAAKGREYHSVVIPDYDCDVSRWTPAEIEEERRVVYVGVTRARDEALFTVDSSRPYVHPFLRELVEMPGVGEHETLSAWLAQEEDAGLRTRIAARLNEIEVLYPELVPTAEGGSA